MTEEPKPQRAVDTASAIDKVIEQKKLDGQIAGLDFFTKEERREVLVELAELYMEDRAGYELRRNELQPWFGCTKGAIDDDVKLFLKRYVPALPKPDDDPVSELVAIAKREPTVLWRYSRTAYATFHRDDHFENHEVDSDDFEDFLTDEYAKEHQCEINGKLEPLYPEREDLRKAVRQIQAYARRGKERDPRIRITEHEGELWIDLGTPDWSAAVVNADGWRIEPIMRAPLVRGGGMRPLPIPIRGGDIQRLRDFVNVRNDAEDEFALFCGAIAAMLNPFGNYLTHLLSGPPNSAKTTTTMVMRAAAH